MVSEMKDDRPELVFALVGPTGVRLLDVLKELKEYLTSFGYTSTDFHLSKLMMDNYTASKNRPYVDECDRIEHMQNVALEFRRSLSTEPDDAANIAGAAMALVGITAIREKRATLTGNPDCPAPAHAYILYQLKHPKEVELLRSVYGASFILIAGHASRDRRREYLVDLITMADDQRSDKKYAEDADRIIDIDDKQPDDRDLGQNVRDTYPLADYFVDLTYDQGEYAIRRFIDLLFGHPFETPHRNEFAMYQAWSASLRSSDESRQVGAVIVKTEQGFDAEGLPTIGDLNIVSTGMNEIPRAGGGLYWSGASPDPRDQNLEVDRAYRLKFGVLAELIEKIRNIGWLDNALEEEQAIVLAQKLLPNLKRTQFMNIGEYSRPVHAEMAALIDSARRGVAVQGLTMYVTTFPCHNCAKHIIAAGIMQVVYLEPYPKSKAELLHREEIVREAVDGIDYPGKVAFRVFTGVAPRQYGRVYSMNARSAKRGGLSKKEWEASKSTLSPRYVMRNASKAYLLSECQELEKLPVEIYRWDKHLLCPKD